LFRPIKATVVPPLKTIDRLLTSIEAMAKRNIAIVPFITHKLPIVLRVSDRVTVLRQGQVVAGINTHEAPKESLAHELVGREVIFRTVRKKVEPGEMILQVEGLTAVSNKDVTALNGVSFSIREGEILGIAGVSGNGQRELVESLAGLRPATDGRIYMDGREITNASSKKRWQLGIGYIPSDRNYLGSIGSFSLVENTLMNYFYEDAFSRGGVLDHKKIRELTEKLIAEFGVATPNPDVMAKNLSGGNLQKLILARVLSRKPRLIIADLPTQGLDIGAIEFVRNKLVEAKADKAGVLLISEDIDEIFDLSDRIAPIYEGRFMGIVPVEEAKRDAVGAMMAGITLKGEQA
ncbi:MAG: ATP-binding cassette domain-containing protein, partial [Anaerolineae bacterium]